MKEGEKGNPEMCPEHKVNYGKQSEMPTGTPPGTVYSHGGVHPSQNPVSGHLKPITLDDRD